MKILDLVGKKFGRLSVLGRSDQASVKPKWVCRCECGTVTVVHGTSLRSGTTVSCGCFRTEKLSLMKSSHRMSHTPEWNAWKSMVSRCGNPKNKDYGYYGGRGIKVTPRWLKFPNFFTDMGPKPVGLTLERIDVNSGYSYENCKWDTREAQSRNTRSNLLVEYEGLNVCVAELSGLTGINYGTLRTRYHAGDRGVALIREVRS